MNRIGQSLALALVVAAASALAETPKPLEQYNSNAVWFENWTGLSNATMTVVAPDGEISEVFAATGTPVYKLSGREIQDGIYRYELSAATDERQKIVNNIDNGRGENARDTVAVPFYLEGAFTVSRGVIITPEDIKEEDQG